MAIQTSASSQRRPALKGRVGRGVNKAYAVFYRNYVGHDAMFAMRIKKYLRADSVVLDAGCGSKGLFRYTWKDSVRLMVGCDISESLQNNPNLSAAVQSNLSSLPFANRSFDVIFSRYVLEHLDRPEVVFAEFARTLKPGGRLIILTPSKHHYVSLVSKVTRHGVHELVSRLRGNQPEDAFPTLYMANSKADLKRYAREAGLTLTVYRTREGAPNYLLWSLPSFLMGVAYERLVNAVRILSPFRVTIIAVFERAR